MEHSPIFTKDGLYGYITTHEDIETGAMDSSLTRSKAKDKDHEMVAGSAPLSMNPFGMIRADNEEIVEVLAEKIPGEVLGVHVIGTAASRGWKR